MWLYSYNLHCKVRKLMLRKLKVTNLMSQNSRITELSLSRPCVVNVTFLTVCISPLNKASVLGQCFPTCFHGSVWLREVERDSLKIILGHMDLKEIKPCSLVKVFKSFIIVMYIITGRKILYMIFPKLTLTRESYFPNIICGVCVLWNVLCESLYWKVSVVCSHPSILNFMLLKVLVSQRSLLCHTSLRTTAFL